MAESDEEIETRFKRIESMKIRLEGDPPEPQNGIDQILELLLKQNELLERHLKAMEAIVGFAAKAIERPVKDAVQ